MKINKNIDPKEIFKSMHSELDAIGKGLKEGNLSTADLKEVREEFENTILEAYKVKFGFKLDSLATEQPNLSMKEVLVQMLDLLPADVKDSHVPILTSYVFDNWKVKPQRLTA